MRFPSKVTPYSDSILAKFPIILSALEKEDLTPNALYTKVKTKISDIGELVEIIDCLFALGKVVILEEEGVLHYVG